MKNIDDGVIKYDHSDFTLTNPLELSEYKEIEKLRSVLFQIKLIGCYEQNSVGYGNISCKKNYLHLFNAAKPQFLISGSQTGNLRELSGKHYTRVINYDIEHFKIQTHGPLKASSESLTHAAIYEANNNINVVIHIHSQKIWEGMLKDHLPSTSALIPYGTKEMATAVQELIYYSQKNYFAMQGHTEGVIIFGNNFKQALEDTLFLYQKYVDSNFFLDINY
ncbi:MAG: hypothetical protein A2381_04680 [Bdellovibrionales bacterium RIFOXYB1_FULL_37_110]|nr:MAG: hypothetical protein A2181_01110 [Bdellovibrionales bacterium RIFOXYA1_FULL_38_20]OFZ50481.1 MAG: hypothetical protein A2417_10660 [Bdellovibrionales bacterium RIFOXYC1_FULL_37_79]OFZ60752.1 MAG: hypothetical protein A2381_04680 [Bdellovibrionales bacterium RIFOXYB1_FULL_37_110]OFZ64466.1 MAG: hypothetical protein A2577_08645 [Bdellovibrionales bacterium RIFOXYD1_FULL_36_51]